MTASIHTVLGEIAPSDLGRCLPHEHLICDFSPVTGGGDHLLNEVELMIDELAYFTAAGGTTLVEVTPPDLGRNHLALRHIAQRSGVQVVMGTGWYRRAFYPEHLDRTGTNEVAEAMVTELTQGAAGTDVRAGVIGEIGVDRDTISGVEERVLRASARAHLRTGAPVSTHSSMFPVGLAQLDVLVEEGMAPDRVVIGHADTYLDTDYHHAVLRRGANLQFDTAGRNHMNPDRRRAESFVRLAHDGWLDRLLLSSDRCLRSDLRGFNGAGYDHVLTSFRQLLLDLGLTADEFDVVTMDNPARVLAW